MSKLGDCLSVPVFEVSNHYLIIAYRANSVKRYYKRVPSRVGGTVRYDL